jgi:hypothetical protein
VLVAARYGYPGAILALVTDDLRIGYWDYQARATWNLGPNDTVGVFAFGSHDYLASRSPSGDPEAAQEMQEQFVSDFHRVDLRYDHTLSAGRLRLALTGGHDRQGAEPTYMTDKSLGARLQLDQRFSESLQLRAGASSQLEYYRIRLTRQGPGEPVVPQSANPPPTNLGGGLHADVVWRPSQRVELVPGARFDLYHSSRVDESGSGRTSTFVPALDPRLSARVRITPAVAWLSTFGLSHQYPSLRVGEIPGPVASIAGFPFGDRKLQSTAQTSQGMELLLPADLMFTATGFYSYFWGLTDLAAGCFQLENATPPPPTPGRPTMFVPPYVCPNNDPVTGRAYGVELLLRRPFSKRLGGMLSYTLSRATKRAHFLSLSGDDERATVPSEFDRTHVLNLILGYDLGRRWRVGSRLVFYTGTPHSKLEGSLPVPPYNAYRNPAFYRVDFRLEKSWRLGRNGSLAFVLEGQNVTLSKEVSGFGGLDCEGTQNGPEATTTCKQPTVGPLTLPSVGIEAVF